MDKEDILNKSEDFANIDDLLGDNDDEDEKPKEIIKVEDFLPPEGDDGFDNDCQQHGLTISVPHLRVKDEESETTANIGKEKMSVFSSGLPANISPPPGGEDSFLFFTLYSAW